MKFLRTLLFSGAMIVSLSHHALTMEVKTQEKEEENEEVGFEEIIKRFVEKLEKPYNKIAGVNHGGIGWVREVMNLYFFDGFEDDKFADQLFTVLMEKQLEMLPLLFDIDRMIMKMIFDKTITEAMTKNDDQDNDIFDCLSGKTKEVYQKVLDKVLNQLVLYVKEACLYQECTEEVTNKYIKYVEEKMSMNNIFKLMFTMFATKLKNGLFGSLIK
jgi:hypothetical protein